MAGIDLERGGQTWAGWYLAPFGRAKEWRLHSPDGANFTAAEIQQLRALALDVDYLQLRVRQLEAELGGQALRVTAAQAATLAAAAEILAQLLGSSAGRCAISAVGALRRTAVATRLTATIATIAASAFTACACA